ncbi:hypothetical protein [Spirosoma taeanense]|uniref:hypothetical protein n=1 Tax=Spirosoma taeanense TaxID=2735870 RepID=UPI0037429451
MAAALGLSASYLHCLKPDQRISQDASERLLLLENLVQHALDTFDGRVVTVAGWLRSSLRELNYQKLFKLVLATQKPPGGVTLL